MYLFGLKGYIDSHELFGIIYLFLQQGGERTNKNVLWDFSRCRIKVFYRHCKLTFDPFVEKTRAEDNKQGNSDFYFSSGLPYLRFF